MTAQSAIPLKWYVPFAQGDSSRVELPVTTSDPTRASQTLGFPPLTMQPPESGGVPPQGEDFNGGLNQVARIAWWVMNGGGWPYDATFASNSNINGYPNGALLQSADLRGQWINTADNNQNNPDTNGTNWVPGFQYGTTALPGLTGGTVTPTPAQAAKGSITLAGTLTSALTIVLPTWIKNWTITNNTTGAFVTIVKTAAGSGVMIPQNGAPTRVTGDGTNIVQAAENVAAATSSTQAMQLGQATGRLLRETIYFLTGGVLYSSVDGAPAAPASSTFAALAATNSVDVEGVGGGGAGGGATATTSTQSSGGGGGASGSWGRARYLSGFNGLTVTIGAAGTPVAGAAGNAGGTTSFGGLLTIPGGGGGQNVTGTTSTSNGMSGWSPVGTAPTGAGIIFASRGQAGQLAFILTSNTIAGAGGSSPYGAGGINTNSPTPNPGTGFGSGGSGSVNAGTASAIQGAAGASGCLIIREYS